MRCSTPADAPPVKNSRQSTARSKRKSRSSTEKFILPQAAHHAHKAYAGSGMLSAAQDYQEGGMQLPYTIEVAAKRIGIPTA